MVPNKLLEEFIRHLRVERGLSQNTWTAYRYQLKGYLGFLADKGKAPTTAIRDDVLAYMEKRKNAGLKASSLFNLTIAIRQFHRFLAGQGHTTGDPTAGMRLPKFKQRLPEPLSIAEMERLLSLPTGNKFHLIRMQAALEMLYSTGMRVSELIGLKINQVNLEECWVKIHGKGDKERNVPIGSKAKDALLRYLEARKKRFGVVQDTLFLNSRGQGLKRGGFWWQLKRMARRVGVLGRVTPHQIRHSTATHLLSGGANVRVLQEILGHSSVKTTERYTHVTAEFLKETCQKAHPRFD